VAPAVPAAEAEPKTRPQESRTAADSKPYPRTGFGPNPAKPRFERGTAQPYINGPAPAPMFAPPRFDFHRPHSAQPQSRSLPIIRPRPWSGTGRDQAPANGQVTSRRSGAGATRTAGTRRRQGARRTEGPATNGQAPVQWSVPPVVSWRRRRSGAGETVRRQHNGQVPSGGQVPRGWFKARPMAGTSQRSDARSIRSVPPSAAVMPSYDARDCSVWSTNRSPRRRVSNVVSDRPPGSKTSGKNGSVSGFGGSDNPAHSQHHEGNRSVEKKSILLKRWLLVQGGSRP